jgi:DNA replication protein DnaC
MAKKDEEEKQVSEINEMIDQLVANAQEALAEYMKMDQEQTDRIVHAMTLAGLDNHMYLAKLAVEETGRGVFEDKVIKNMFATEYIYHSIKDEKTVGIIEENEMEGYVEVAEPVGVVAGVTPVTNPTSTTMFKSIICAKTRNPIIFAFHPSAQQCSKEAARLLRDAAIKSGAPKYCIQWIETPSLEATNALMKHNGVSLILATGGAGMVKAAYSAGKPALGVGPGNVPCYINKNVDINRACTDLIISKTFDNGMICASEQAVIVDEEIAEEFERTMKKYGCYFLKEEEIEPLTKYVINLDKMAVNGAIVGKSAYEIATGAGKTYLAACIANKIIEDYQIRVKMRNIPQIINDIEKRGFDIDKNDYYRKLSSVSLLILDDFGIERNTEYVNEMVYQIINTRYESKKPTIISTNIPLGLIMEGSNDIDKERIYSRLREMCIPVKIAGKDMRREIGRKKLRETRDLLLGDR